MLIIDWTWIHGLYFNKSSLSYVQYWRDEIRKGASFKAAVVWIIKYNCFQNRYKLDDKKMKKRFGIRK